MKVRELIEILGKMDAEANVMLAQQPGYPYAERRLMRSAGARVR